MQQLDSKRVYQHCDRITEVMQQAVVSGGAFSGKGTLFEYTKDLHTNHALNTRTLTVTVLIVLLPLVCRAGTSMLVMLVARGLFS